MKLLCLFVVIAWVAPICSVDPDVAVTCEDEGSGVVRIDYEPLDESDLDCMASTNPHYADWVAWGKPDCWCYPRQCRGDMNGLKTGPFWVQQLDKDLFRYTFGKTDTALSMTPNGICADLNHTKTGPFRVQALDKDIFRLYFNQSEFLVPPCSGVDDCGVNGWPCDTNPLPNSEYNFWMTP